MISYDVTLKGGLNAGNFTPTGTVDSMETCVRKCCESQSCDVAFMLKDSCYTVGCVSEELCEEVPAPSSAYYPRLSFVRRDPNDDRTGEFLSSVLNSFEDCFIIKSKGILLEFKCTCLRTTSKYLSRFQYKKN